MNTKSMLYVAKKIDNDLVAIGKSKVTLRLNKPAYVAMYILDLSKVYTSIYDFHHDCIKNKYVNKSRLALTDTNSLMYEIKTEDVYMKILVSLKKCLILVIIQLS